MTRHRLPLPIPPARAAFFCGLLTLLLILVLFPLLPSRLHVHEGDIASQTITAPHNFSYSSDVVRQRLRDEAARSVKDVIAYDVNVKSAQLSRLDDEVVTIDQVRGLSGLTRAEQEAQLARRSDLKLSPAGDAAVLGLSADEWKVTADEARRVLGEVLQEPFSSADLAAKQASIPARTSNALSQTQRDVAAMLVQPLVVPTEKVDEQATQAQRERAIDSVPPQIVHFARNQDIVRQGEPVDATDVEALRAAGLLNARLRLADLASVVLVAFSTAAALGLYLWVFQPPSLNSPRRLVILASLIAIIVLLAKLYLPLVLPDQSHHFYPFALPVALTPVLVAALFEAPLALMVAALVSALVTFTAIYLPELSGYVGLGALQVIQMLLAFLLASVAGVYVVDRAERLGRYLLAGVAVAAASFVCVIAIWLLDPSRHPAEIGWALLACAVSGALTSLLSVGAFALIGPLFNISTRLQLMELGQLNAPLLRRLQDEAPGTFHHSILVGNLAERAADLIGANALLVRVGCYYHDIGKMSRPGYFVENQLSGGNPHDSLEPGESARVIADHVRYGLDLARRYHLPDSLHAFIAQHHGTRTVSYFYRKAAQRDPEVDPAAFSYPGPRPQSRETAIVMLADSTEAAVRAATDRSPERISALVESVIAERLAEGQFDDCDLTMRDLRTIADSFTSTLRAIYHPRIEYPEPTRLEEARRSRFLRRQLTEPVTPGDAVTPAVGRKPS